MQKMNFPSHFIHLIMSSITMVSYSILLNGIPTRSFTLSRGILQAILCLPILFILCSEGFSGLYIQQKNLDHSEDLILIGDTPFHTSFLWTIRFCLPKRASPRRKNWRKIFLSMRIVLNRPLTTMSPTSFLAKEPWIIYDSYLLLSPNSRRSGG